MNDDLVARLRKVDPDQPGERTRWYRNPDGPEAADRIERLEAALEKAMSECLTIVEDFQKENERRTEWRGSKTSQIKQRAIASRCGEVLGRLRKYVGTVLKGECR